MVPGNPIAVLIDFQQLRIQTNDIYAWAWNNFQVQSHAAYGDYEDSALFGYAVGQVMESLYNHLTKQTKTPLRFIAHANEWQTAFTVFYMRHFCPSVRTVFTTHATGIGRSIAGNGKPLYDYFEGYNGDQMAAELNMVSKHSAEKQAAHYAHCFTTVSELTARECKQLLDKQPDIVTPNGFELDFVPKGKDFNIIKQHSRESLLLFAQKQIHDTTISQDALLVAIAGRLEWKNKGIDVFVEAMQRLAQENLNRQVVAFVLIPYLQQPNIRVGNVNVIFAPYYFPLRNINDNDILQPLQDLSYYDLLIGMDMTVFPSYYEPWGYTPMESIAFHVPTVTTDLSGFGVWANHNQSAQVSTSNLLPVTVIHRTDSNSEEVIYEIIKAIRTYSTLGAKEINGLKKQAERLSLKSTWKQFFDYYNKAYSIALQK